MGKRSNFERRERDFYPTPKRAVEALVPHLPLSFGYSEPCVGDGALVAAIQEFVSRSYCFHACDIRKTAYSKMDALELSERHLSGCDLIITNPPWDRKILHAMIEHFADLRPTWLLFDADWAHTKQAAPYLPRLRKIVSVGRLKWIPDSPYTGKDNCAWHLFGKPSDDPAEFYGRAAA